LQELRYQSFQDFPNLNYSLFLHILQQNLP